MRIDRQVAGIAVSAIAQEIAGHPMIFAAAGQVLDRLAEIAATQPGTTVLLHRGRIELRHAPAVGDQGAHAVVVGLGAAQHDQHRHRRFGGQDDMQGDVDGDARETAVIDMADGVPHRDGPVPDHRLFGRAGRPGDGGRFLGRAAEHVALEIGGDLRAAHMPPLGRRCHLAARSGRQQVRPVGERIGERLVIIGMVGGGGISARARAQGLDAEAIQHRPMILLGGGRGLIRKRQRRQRQKRANEQGA